MVTLPQPSERFIVSAIDGRPGEAAEGAVWQSLKTAFSRREAFGYWRYPLFSNVGQRRKEPDILVCDRELGLCIIEVKALRIDNIDRLHGHVWKLKNFRTDQENPYDQAEQHMYQLLGRFMAEPRLRDRVSARVLVGLPYITRQQWEERGWHKLPSQPPILFRDDLKEPLEVILATPELKSRAALDPDQWDLLQKVIASKTIFVQQEEAQVDKPLRGRAVAVDMTRRHLFDLDLQQEKTGKQIPPGPQRIRGPKRGSGVRCRLTACPYPATPRLASW